MTRTLSQVEADWAEERKRHLAREIQERCRTGDESVREHWLGVWQRMYGQTLGEYQREIREREVVL